MRRYFPIEHEFFLSEDLEEDLRSNLEDSQYRKIKRIIVRSIEDSQKIVDQLEEDSSVNLSLDFNGKEIEFCVSEEESETEFHERYYEIDCLEVERLLSNI